MKKVVIVGEAGAKRNFLCGFLDEGSRNILYSLCVDYAVVEAVHSDVFLFSVETGKGKIGLSTPKIPNGIKIIADFGDTSWNHCDEAKSADMILFLEEYPFTTDSLMIRLKKIEDHLKGKISNKQLNAIQYRVVFLRDCSQKYGAMEMVDVEKALNSAPDVIRRKLSTVGSEISLQSLVDYIICKDMNNIAEVFSVKSNTFIMLLSAGKKTLGDWQSELKYFEEDYSFSYSSKFDWGRRAGEFDREVSGFNAVKKRCTVNYNDYILYGRIQPCKSDVYNIYVRNYRNSCFGEIKEFALDLYDDYINRVCFWDIEADKKRLSEQLDKLCERVLTFSDRIPCPEKPSDYQELRAKDKTDVKFSEKVKVLEMKEIPHTIYGYLQEKEGFLLGKKALEQNRG